MMSPADLSAGSSSLCVRGGVAPASHEHLLVGHIVPRSVSRETMVRRTPAYPLHPAGRIAVTVVHPVAATLHPGAGRRVSDSGRLAVGHARRPVPGDRTATPTPLVEVPVAAGGG